jgi:hypothetical protein
MFLKQDPDLSKNDIIKIIKNYIFEKMNRQIVDSWLDDFKQNIYDEDTGFD